MELQLKRLRAEHKCTQTDIALVCGTHKNVVSSWERGEVRLPLEDAVKIADFFKCSLDELAGRDFQPRKTSYFDDVFASVNEEGQRYLLKQANYAMADPAFQTERHYRKVQ